MDPRLRTAIMRIQDCDLVRPVGKQDRSKIATGEASRTGSYRFRRSCEIRSCPIVDPENTGIGETYPLLRSMGVPPSIPEPNPHGMMERVMGKNGIILWERGQRHRHDPGKQYSESKSVSTETTFEQDTIRLLSG